MAAVPGFIPEFHIVIKRHLDDSRQEWDESGSKKASTLGTSAKSAIEESPIDYLDALEELCDNISASLKNPVEDLNSVALRSPMLLWMIPAFCFCSQFLDPVDAYARCVAIQKTRSNHEANFTDDIWNKDLVHDWAGSDDSCLLLLQGNSGTTKRFERFAVEVIQAMKSDQAPQLVRLVYILKTPRSGEISGPLVPADVLQQLAVQCLQYARPKGPVSFLINICGKFKEATTSQDWFDILHDICLLIPSLYMIIDLSVLGRNYDETQLWPAYIQDMFNSLSSSQLRCRLKVMILCCHKFTSHVGETLVIKTQPVLSASYRNRHPARKYLRRIVTDPEDPSVDPVQHVEAFGNPEDTSLDPVPDFRPFVDSRGPVLAEKLALTKKLALTGKRTDEVPKTTPPRVSDITHSNIKPSSLPEPRNTNDFKIAIICALTLEADAVQDIFDRRWDENTYGKRSGDPNHYTMGVIGRHDVVLVHMPGMGKSNGASVAADCRASFPNLGLVLVVGICGGVPFIKGGTEIILGDVIISDGLIQYDFGRQFPDRFVRKSDNMPNPNAEILSFLAKMKGRWGMKTLRARTALHLQQLSLLPDLKEIVQYPGALKDKLYEPTYRHKHQAAPDCEVCGRCRTSMDPVCEDALTLDCERLQCHDKHLIARKRLAAVGDEPKNPNNYAGPSIHFGLYASGDKVMKSGEDRDIIAREEGVIAFEMEGSGVWEGFSGRCLVIKAVCDYADSHKNKSWQLYAAASAAACTKAFLESWSA